MTTKAALKNKLHPRNRHKNGYDFDALCKTSPALAQFVAPNRFGNASIDFANANAVKALNAAILKLQYKLEHWDIPQGFLCPPIPGRVDYIHYLADLLRQTNNDKVPAGKKITGLDIGTGASCIYPVLGQREYGWHFVASDIDPISIKSSQLIIESNQGLDSTVSTRLQPNANAIFEGIINASEYFDFTLCNPPFHKSLADAAVGSQRKRHNLGTNKQHQDKLNFGGQKAELWCPGGELTFIRNMIKESKSYGHQVLWFTALVSKKDNLRPLKQSLKKAHASDVKVVSMAQGQKTSRFIAWTFLNKAQQQTWCEERFSD
ncbi:23S rRNA (adenine(1618)-N(6))-methyltransferase RlmF [Psychrobium sp. 1_MG-2023]|uniref:23S rRNA (adenine(1618)-N(6))-methyltransferase RlmF n=1 Tax=Psychrobium sp. 1_MG-2023 TaxID=3062624 RepID=UPI000C335553|nr:23S rRNA (adenine(1618)-N(6))-methyltransferase RlmF [Psychrobium sp. 1_MG-2023]MDP2562307.1 23S rRNA (adenine(1618)-N(6))-methyltransferase RlmF [Psychrobium sp. 1_MG-2023]PKF54690.1 23S rRNA (adenine(1618)-N(6))-methyltransferase RlmF [Alteromonadales bacterium alter-6D02]